jgi:iron complex outermembrane receptor protein
MELGRASNFEDLLQRTPGVFLQSENGSEVSKISIRGSGITSEDEPLGVMFLMDGLNFNQGDGETTLEDLDVAALSHAEVFRGADAFKYGALTVGGQSISYRSPDTTRRHIRSDLKGELWLLSWRDERRRGPREVR